MASIVELRELSDQELEDLLEDAREELFNLRFQKAAGSLENTTRLRLVRRDIAQLNEVLRKREIAVGKAVAHESISAAVADKEWTGSAQYIYEDGAWAVTIVDDNDNEIATAMVDLNSKRRKTRRDRNRKPKVRVLSYTIAG